MSLDDRSDALLDSISELVSQNLIEDDSVYYDEENGIITFIYSAGILGSVIINDWDDFTNGQSDEDVIVSSINYQPTGIQNLSLNSADSSVGDAIILWSFNQSWDDEDYRKPFYETTKSEWDSLGLNTTVDWDVTVNDYKHLPGYEVIVFSGHGAYTTFTQSTGFLQWESLTAPALVLTEKASEAKDKEYSTDLKKFRIGKTTVTGGVTLYMVFPGLFNYYYSNGELDGSFVFAENCEFRGKNNNVNDAMAAAITNTSAEAVIGFHNSVMADYSRNLMKQYVEGLIDGKTVTESFNYAKGTYGDNDYFDGRTSYGPTAYPLMRGDGNAKLVNTDFENGSFENGLAGWSASGDIRVTSQLGAVVPQHESKMALLTTGIGSQESEYLGATEGSVLSQTFIVPSDAASLSLKYDVVSEEPMEFVGSQFDDKLIIQIVTGSGTTDIAKEEVNTSTWLPITGINFEGGDSTVYHTGWKSVTADLSAYKGKSITIKIVVYDVGDSIYDTAAVIDDIKIQ
jgi:hypothetical protein